MKFVPGSETTRRFIHTESRKIFDKFLEAGGNFMDTADGYQIGESEGNSCKTMVRALKASLKRLKTDHATEQCDQSGEGSGCRILFIPDFILSKQKNVLVICF